MSSILNDVKHILGHTEDDTVFDSDLMILINGVFSTLHQLGVGPTTGYQITGPANEWAEFTTDARLNSVKTYIFLKVKLAFNPPDTGFVLTAMEEQIRELEYRLNVVADYG